MLLAAGVRPDHLIKDFSGQEAPRDLAPNVPWLTLAQIMALVEKRLRWYGFAGWRIRDAVCNAGSTVTVLLRGEGRATLAITLGRDGGVHEVNLVQDPPAAPVPRPVAAYKSLSLTSKSLCKRAIAALTPEPALGTV